MSEEKCCGNCCWFCHEDTDGWGQCMHQDLCDTMHCSDLCTTDKYVSREEMRHHMAVLLQMSRSWDYSVMHFVPSKKECEEAVLFAYKYMKAFSKL